MSLLFDLETLEVPTAQAQNLRRVSGRIATAVIAFVRSRAGQRFKADELREYVANATGVLAPASADRILRDCRQRGLIRYVVVDRAGSEYEAAGVQP